MFVDDTFGGHLVFTDHVEPADPELYQQFIRLRASRYLQEDLWAARYVEGLTHSTRMRMTALHYSSTRELIYAEMMRLIQHTPEFQAIELRAIQDMPVVVPAPAPLAPELAPVLVPDPEVPEIVVPDVQDPPEAPELIPQPLDAEPLMVVVDAEEDEDPDEEIDEDPEEDMEPEEGDDLDDEEDPQDDEIENLEEDEEPEMDLEEHDPVDEDEVVEDVVVPQIAPAAVIDAIDVIAQVAAQWAAEMVAQPAGFVIGAAELAEGIVDAVALAEAAAAAEEDDDDDEPDFEDGMMMADIGEPMDEVPPDEIPIDVEDDVPPCESDMEDFWDRIPRI